MNRIDRLFGMVTFLQAQRHVPAEKMADKFGISIRTVYRDVKALCEGGIAVNFEPGKGYFIVQGYFVPPVAFTTEEANALLLMESVVDGFADQSIRRHYTTALHKIKSVLRSKQKESLENLIPNIKVQVPERLRNNFDYLSLLQQCIAEKKIIEIAYRNNQQEESLRLVEPIGLVFYAFGWHLIGWCHKRRQYRDFKVERIQKVCDTRQPFTHKEHFSLADYMKELPVAY